MFQPLPLFVGLRYVRARTQKFFVSFITWVSLVGVCLGVAALIVILNFKLLADFFLPASWMARLGL